MSPGGKIVFCYVIEIERNGKRLAYVKKVYHGNLVNMFPEDAKIIHPVKTLKKAIETAAAWNQASQKNGYEFCFKIDPIKYGPPVIVGWAFWE